MKQKLFAVTIILLLIINLCTKAQSIDTLKNNYTKQIVQIPMRDGIKLMTIIYSPKDRTEEYPIILMRTPYRIGNYEKDEFSLRNFPPEYFINSKYIFVMQDVRGKFMSEGDFIDMRPYVENKQTKNDVDESSDTYDTIDWLINNVENNNGKVGEWGISYPGFYAAMAAIEAHPNLAAVSPQAPISDWFIGDDMHHNGAFSLQMAFNFFKGFGQPRPKPTTDWAKSPQYDSPDAYNFFLKMGPIKNLNEKILKGNVEFWNEAMQHGNYDEFWQSRNNLPHFKNITPAVMTVGGWFDSEDLYGPLHIYKSIENKNPNAYNILVMGPWTHGGWVRSKGSNLGAMNFGVNNSQFYIDSIFIPYFDYYLKGINKPDLPEAYIFGTGENKWHRYDSWPPADAKEMNLYFSSNGNLSADEIPSTDSEYEEFISDPQNPVPYTAEFHDSRTFYRRTYMSEDQRFASSRPDVITFETQPLKNDLTVVGPINADLFVSTTGTDADWVVKLIDVFPDSTSNPKPNPEGYEMSGMQMMIRYDIFRGKFRNSFENPEPFVPGKVTNVNFDLNDIHHTFKKGHKIMVQVQSSMFPFYDRNPQTFCDIYNCDENDFVKAEHKVFHTEQFPSKIRISILDK